MLFTALITSASSTWGQQLRLSDGRTEAGPPRGWLLLDKGFPLNSAVVRPAATGVGARPMAVSANNITFGAPVSSQTQIADFSTTLTNSTSVTSYTIVTRPATGALYAYNAVSGANQQITANNVTYSAVTYPNLIYISTANTGNVPFTYTATDNTGAVSNT
ncbi:hypothetical protein, partial [Thermocatellispora tengchongensis]|uniref:hypothetical protein n=1 Tax=Thermocatellispora tengchongensis TaxID=1073253 RepID=UPI0031E69674